MSVEIKTGNLSDFFDSAIPAKKENNRMGLLFKCPECGQVSDYTIEDITGSVIPVYRGETPDLSKLPETISIYCKICSKQFKVFKKDIPRG